MQTREYGVWGAAEEHSMMCVRVQTAKVTWEAIVILGAQAV